MSVWYNPKYEDMEIDTDEKEVHILIDQDKFGNVYAALQFDDIKKLYHDIVVFENEREVRKEMEIVKKVKEDLK